EAVFLARQGFDDILIAYPTCDPQDISAVAETVALGKHLILMVDCREHVDLANRAAIEKKVQLPLCLDVDMSTKFPGLHFGVQRSGIRSVAEAKALFDYIRQHDFLYLDGIMGYEAQLAGLADNVPGQYLKNQVIRLLQRFALVKVRSFRAAVVAAIGSENLRFVNAGGTGSLETSSEEPVVTEVTAGSAFYAPALFDGYSHFQHQPAAGFALEITRQPEPGIYTCFGGGYVASGATGKTKLPVPYLPEGAALLPNEGAGEVQTPVLYRGPQPLQLGDPIFFRHAKAGELCEHFNHLYLIQNGQVVDCVPTYRGEGVFNPQ
ncbi:MAG: alanine racemase, partial [Saprospiraceae bacterium]|nr:alanine racemase [Saprospiraceae bacterium]